MGLSSYCELYELVICCFPLDAAIVSRHLLHEAQQAHYYGLPSNIALRSVISTPADVMGYDHRIGYIREGENNLSVQKIEV